MIPIVTFAFFAVTTRLPPRKTEFFIAELFRNKMVIAIVVAQFLMFMGIFVPMFYLAAYAESRGMNPTLAKYLVAIYNGASLLGRVIPDILADKFGGLNMLLVAGTCTGALVLCWNQTTTNASIIVFSVFFGFCSGAIISGGSVALTTTTTKDPLKLGTYLGVGVAIASFAVLITPPR